MSTYEQSTLWKRTLANQGNEDPHAEARERLRNAFQRTREKVAPLIAKIGQELPMLTVHDITHIDSLWAVADKLLGDDYPINPAEAFVLGMAFLLHDAATSSFAYPGGIDGLRNTTQWRDFVAQKQFPDEAMAPGQPGDRIALFETLRLLHPHQAEKLLGQVWTDNDGKQHRLLEDNELVNAYGLHIGKIAASHGKDAADAERTWANTPPLPPPPSIARHGKGEDWSVDRLKLAMLLRCIDAAHIDSFRAPDFLHALNAPTGESKHHWSFQNKLSALGITQNHHLYWSGQAFEEKDSEAWWRCHDTIAMIDREIRGANKILAHNGKPLLRAVGVLGANDIDELRKHIPTHGWHPLDIRYQVSRVGSVIENFGGEKLYGDKPYLALRELLQNAVDAIHARRLHRDSSSIGLIQVVLEERDGSWWLDVTDDGIGMSRYVLTEVLLDFGRSLWSDNALREQWQGLAAKGFRSAGKFGIGFFSVFMLGDEVKVTTWRDGDAESEQATLHLRDRVNVRPMLVETPVGERLQQFGTRVSVRLKDGRAGLLHLLHKSFYSFGDEDRPFTLAELVGILAPAVDVDVQTRDGNQAVTACVRANDWRTLPYRDLLKRISPALDNDQIDKRAKFMSDVREPDGSLCGRIGIDGNHYMTIGLNTGITTHQGILTGFHALSGLLLSHNNFDLARNTASPNASADAIVSFAEAQLEMMESVDLWAASRLLSLGIDFNRLPIAEVDGNVFSVADVARHARAQLEQSAEVIVMIEEPRCPDSISVHEFEEDITLYPDIICINSFMYGRYDFGLKGWLEAILPSTQEVPRSLVEAVHRTIESVHPGCVNFVDGRPIGEACGMQIESKCWIFALSTEDKNPPADAAKSDDESPSI
jgi:Histidine kinase-, DNA gyrase B-, and HSP90-like ATPase